MPFYAQINAYGVAIAVTESHAAIGGDNIVELPKYNPDILGMRWTGTHWEAVPREPEPVQRRITPLAFRRRFSAAERAAIEWAAVDRADAGQQERMQAAQLRSNLKDQELASFIDLDDPDVAAGVQLLEDVGLIADGRALQITDTPPRPDELPA
ncbi:MULTISPECIES: hypothetical protein [unclassified Delftia]|uniref:hypothetical protein n=1 Tax=unclassified Delftia TaxID=2613839 RepID=UPI0019008618|nr:MULTISPECIES: hypothetical protein [unclassified Delftia]MBK0114715.1 hypothetical protein [Delftia sp. S65]MBK0120353.1 hypothetical protein [Delftia sp. S67]MBK0133072.1 hypothetical protein [Delftia sp. S66]